MSKGYAGAICEAEARVNGVLRGGKYNTETKVFTFHAGTMKIETKDITELRRFRNIVFFAGTEHKKENMNDI